MVLKLWEIDNGKVTYLKHTNNKNEGRLIKLKISIEPDKIPMSKLDEAIELMTEFVSSVKKFDNVVVVKDGKDEKVDDKSEVKVANKPEVKVADKSEVKVADKPEVKVADKPEVKVADKPEVKIEAKPDVKVSDKSDVKIEAKPDVKVADKSDVKIEAKPDINVEKWAWEEEYDKDDETEIPQEVNDKLGLLLKDDGGGRNGPQFLININAGKRLDTDKSFLSPLDSKTDDTIVPNEEIVNKRKHKTEKRKRYSGYKEAIVKCVPKLLGDIADSNDDKTLVNASDLAKMMGSEFADIRPSLLYTNVVYNFFDHGLIMTMLSPDETDIYANNGEKVFRFRLKNEYDKLPESVLRQRHKVSK